MYRGEPKYSKCFNYHTLVKYKPIKDNKAINQGTNILKSHLSSCKKSLNFPSITTFTTKKIEIRQN